MEVGARYLGGGKCRFDVWAPFPRVLELVILEQDGKEEQQGSRAGAEPDNRDDSKPEYRVVSSKKDDQGYWRFDVENVFPGTRYYYRLDGSKDRPDPASRYQPGGVNGPSQMIDHRYPWRDGGWKGIPIEEMIIYELHTGTFTEEGTFEAVIPRLEALRELGITAVEIMPVGQFPGRRNWGYDVAYSFAVQNSYGGPQGLKRLVDACHASGLAVILDVVYNHLGPEGNYLADYGPYFTDRYRTPWGSAINFDGPCSDPVRDFFFENALAWFMDYHLDALRLDAVHAIFDMSAKPFLRELAERVDGFSKSGRRRYLMAESDLNDIRLIDSWERNGFGIDAQWSDDLHHALHALLTGERKGYYEDFGSIEDLAKALSEGFVYSWRYSKYRKRHHGSRSRDFPANRFIVSSQNHDQVGNRPLGERLTSLVSFEALKLAAGAVILSPYVPLIFMGEEYAEEAPFLYFVSHSDPALAEATRAGRRSEFREASGEPFDPQDPQTFFLSRIFWQRREMDRHRVMLEYCRQLIRLRKTVPALRNLRKDCQEVSFDGRLIFVRRWHASNETLCIMNFGETATAFPVGLAGDSWNSGEEFCKPGKDERKAGGQESAWKKIIDSSDSIWDGPGSSMPDLIAQSENDLTVRSERDRIGLSEGDLIAQSKIDLIRQSENHLIEELKNGLIAQLKTDLIRQPEKFQIKHPSFLLYEKVQH